MMQISQRHSLPDRLVHGGQVSIVIQALGSRFGTVPVGGEGLQQVWAGGLVLLGQMGTLDLCGRTGMRAGVREQRVLRGGDTGVEGEEAAEAGSEDPAGKTPGAAPPQRPHSPHPSSSSSGSRSQSSRRERASMVPQTWSTEEGVRQGPEPLG